MSEWLEYIDENQYTIHLDKLFKLLLKNIWIIILCALLIGGGAFAYASYFITPLYQSSIKMYVNNTTNASDSTSITSSDITASQDLVDTYAVVLTSYPTLNAVIEQTGVHYTYDQMSSMVSTSAIGETEVFKVTVTSADANEAAEIANAIAEVAPDEIMSVVSGSSVKIVEYARVATSPSSPDRTKFGLIGTLIGIVISCLCIMVSSLLRNSMSVEEKIRKDFKNKAVLSVIPYMGKKNKSGKKGRKSRKKGKAAPEQDAELCEHLSFASAEAYKLLRENVTFSFSNEQGGKTCRFIGVTSSMRSEGKSTSSVNLAYALALANNKVCLIDCDLRIPAIANRLNLRRKPGMTNYLAGKTNGSDLIQTYRGGETGFYVIPAGDVSPNPSELLGSKRMKSLLDTIGQKLDYVILDLPPIGIVSDALAVTRYIDGMLFVVREDFYERKILRESIRILEGVNTKMLGMIVTHSTTQEKEYRHYGDKYGYKYGYQYGYGDGNKDATEDNRKEGGSSARHEKKK